MANDFNAQVIEEFRANGGKVGGMFADMPLLLLTTTGRKSGEPRVSPLVYKLDGDRYVVAGSNGGQDKAPLWVGNLAASPTATVEVGDESFDAVVTVESEGAERDRLFEAHAEAMPQFRDYEKSTDRRIPMIVLAKPTA